MYHRLERPMKFVSVMALAAITLWGAVPARSVVAQGSVTVDTSGAGTNVTVTGGSTSIKVTTSEGSGQGAKSSTTTGGSGQTSKSTTTTTRSSGQGASSSAQKDKCGNRYVPFMAGAQWQYQMSGEEETRFTRTIVSVSGNKATVRDVFADDEEEVNDQWLCRSGAIVTSGASVMADVAGEGFSVGAVSVNEGVTLPADPKPGNKWSQTMRYGGGVQAGGQNIGGETQIKTDCRAARLETVTVPAGKFNNALRVDCTQEIKVKAGVAGIVSADVPVTVKYSEWYALGVGMVKSVSEGSTTVLVSYRIP